MFKPKKQKNKQKKTNETLKNNNLKPSVNDHVIPNLVIVCLFFYFVVILKKYHNHTWEATIENAINNR